MIDRWRGWFTAAGATETAVAETRSEAELLMQGRRMLNFALERKGDRLIEDACVPIARLGDFVRAGQQIADRTGVEITLSGHGGDGNLHPSLFFDRADEASWHRAEAALAELMRVVLDLGGTITGEHGVGTLKRDYLRWELGDAEIARQLAVKAVFDPRGIMNPGKVF